MSSMQAASNKIQFDKAAEIYRNLTPDELIDHAVKNGEGVIAAHRALVEYTGK